MNLYFDTSGNFSTSELLGTGNLKSFKTREMMEAGKRVPVVSTSKGVVSPSDLTAEVVSEQRM